MALYVIRQEIVHLISDEFTFLCTEIEIADRYHIAKEFSKYHRFCKKCLGKCGDDLLSQQEVAWLTGMTFIDVKRATDNWQRGGRGKKSLEFVVVKGKRMITRGEAIRWIDNYRPGAFR